MQEYETLDALYRDKKIFEAQVYMLECIEKNLNLGKQQNMLYQHIKNDYNNLCDMLDKEKKFNTGCIAENTIRKKQNIQKYTSQQSSDFPDTDTLRLEICWETAIKDVFLLLTSPDLYEKWLNPATSIIDKSPVENPLNGAAEIASLSVFKQGPPKTCNFSIKWTIFDASAHSNRIFILFEDSEKDSQNTRIGKLLFSFSINNKPQSHNLIFNVFACKHRPKNDSYITKYAIEMANTIQRYIWTEFIYNTLQKMLIASARLSLDTDTRLASARQKIQKMHFM